MQDNIYLLPVQEPSKPDRKSLHNLPIQLTPLLGRKQEIASASSLMRRSEISLLTLTGAGGVGKTRLALQVASSLLEDFADGVYFVPLASIIDSNLVVSSIAQVLGVKESAERSLLDLLKDFLYDKHLLLLIDNFEQVLTAAPLLIDMLTTCPNLKMLVTSRAVLRVQGEYEFLVPPLALPTPTLLSEPEVLLQYAATALFLQRAQAVKPAFQLNATNAHTIAEICIRLDGLPLAIELAAARIKLLPPQALLSRLEHRLEVLTRGAQDVQVQQRTLRNTLAWSYHLLDELEQRLFRWLSTFEGGCRLQAIEAVVGSFEKSYGSRQVLDGVASLLDKSLLQQTEHDSDEPRLVMLETIREYGIEMLVASGEMESIRMAHANYYLQLAEQTAPKMNGSEQLERLKELEYEHKNLSAAMHWLLEQGESGRSRELALRLGRALWQFWTGCGLYSEGRTFLNQALSGDKNVATPVRAKALATAADLASWQGDDEQVEALSQQCLILYQEIGDKRGIGHSLWLLATVAWRKRSDFKAARALFEESLALQRDVGDQVSTAWVLLLLAETISMQGEYTRGQELFEESLTIFQTLGNSKGIARSLRQSALWIFACQGDVQTVHARLAASLAISKKLGDKQEIASCLWLAGWIALHMDSSATAQTLLEESISLFKELGDKWFLSFTLTYLGNVEVRQGDLTAAQMHFEESLMLARAKRHQFNIALCIEGLAKMAEAQGHLARAARLWGTAESMRVEMGIPSLPVQFPVERATYEKMITSVRTQLGKIVFNKALAEGRRMTSEQVLAGQGTVMMLQSGPDVPQLTVPKKPPTYPSGLTIREAEILRLLSLGWTDAQIADQLVISPRTVNRHTTSLYSKLGVSSRSAAARYAFEHHLQ